MALDDTDLRGLSAEEAKAYALEFMTALKVLERDLATLADDVALWVRRVELAGAKGSSDLEAAARARLDELTAKSVGLQAERDELRYKVSRISENLRTVSASQRSVDADLLLAQLRMAAGLDPDDRDGADGKLESDLAALGTDDALAALKRSIEEGKKE
ncbi:MAG: hypothetical protein RBT62_12075 [Spirochaetia bacterium]|jgi:hypothetical protein|nr:hypothetical protein [Spirochaetia bacterium]